MAALLYRQIRKYIDQDIKTIYPHLTINESQEIDGGIFYDFSINNSRFCMILKNLKNITKVIWVFYRRLNDDEKEYWTGKYEFKLDSSDDQYLISRIRIGNISKEGIKFIMNRNLETLRIFEKDLKWILIMERVKEVEQ